MANKGALTLASTFALPAGTIPYGLAPSPDGKNLYVVLNGSTTTLAGVAQLAIDQTTGALSTIAGKSTFINVSSAMRYAAVSPDGKNVYATASGNSRIHTLARDAADGSLTVPFTYTNANVSYPVGITVSPDNAHVYVAMYTGGSAAGNIRVYSRNTSTGALTEIQSVPLVGAFHVAVTPDGNAFYVTSATASTISGYVRDNNPASGTYGQLSSPVTTATPSGSAATIEITDDGLFVYVACDSGSQFTGCYSRNPSTNVLTDIGHPAQTSDNNGGPWGSALSRDSGNTSLYIALSDVQKITQYDRSSTDLSTGGLKFKTPGSVTTSNVGLASPQGGGSKGPYDVAVTPNNKFLYATALGTDSVDVFTIDQGVAAPTAVSADFPGTFSILGSVQQDLAGSFSVLATVQQDFAGSFSALAGVQQNFAGSFSMLGSVSQNFVGSFDILASGPTAVSADIVGTFSIVSAVMKDFAGSFSVLAGVQRNLIGTFDVASAVGPIDVSKISPSRVVVFEGSGSRVVVFEGSGPRVRFDQMSAIQPTKVGDKWTVPRDPDEKSHYAADITDELADRATTALSVELVLVGVVQIEPPQIQTATLAGVPRTFVVAFLGGTDAEPPEGWKWVARVTCANGERFDKTTWFNKVDP
jgi:DNA-binding beta-propeller fold protein YncE